MAVSRYFTILLIIEIIVLRDIVLYAIDSFNQVVSQVFIPSPGHFCVISRIITGPFLGDNEEQSVKEIA